MGEKKHSTPGKVKRKELRSAFRKRALDEWQSEEPAAPWDGNIVVKPLTLALAETMK